MGDNNRDEIREAVGKIIQAGDLSIGRHVPSEPSDEVRELDGGIGQVVPSVAEEYLIDTIVQRGISPSNPQGIQDSVDRTIAISQANQLARLVGTATEAFNTASLYGDREELRVAREALLGTSDLLEQTIGFGAGDPLLADENNPESSEGYSYFRGFLAHHDLVQYEKNGKHGYMTDPDEKVAQSGDYVPRPEAYAPGNILEQNQQQQNNTVTPPKPPAIGL